MTEFPAHQFTLQGAVFGANHYSEIPLGTSDPVFILVALTMAKNGKGYSFSNYPDRLISFILYNKDMINKK